MDEIVVKILGDLGGIGLLVYAIIQQVKLIREDMREARKEMTDAVENFSKSVDRIHHRIDGALGMHERKNQN